MAIVLLGPKHYQEVYRFLVRDEPWSIIPFDAFLRYGIQHPEHLWYGEIDHGRLKGIVYGHRQFIYLFYPPSVEPSNLDPFLKNHYPRFVFSGLSSRAQWMMEKLPSYHAQLMDRSRFVVQSPLTLQRIMRYGQHKGGTVRIRLADRQDYGPLLALYQGSEVAREVDPSLLKQLIEGKQVLVAEEGQLVGSVMLLKESLRYALLGGLFVDPAFRNQGIAARLGQAVFQMVLARGKRACFYYRHPALTPFYDKGAFLPIGLWDQLYFTSK